MSPSASVPIKHGPADAALNEADAAQDQRAHDALAEVGLGHQQRAQFVRCDQQRLDVAVGMTIDQRDAAGELADLGQELPGTLVDDVREVAKPVAMADADIARQQHEHAGPWLAGLEQRLVVLVAPHLAEPAHAVDLVRRQRRKRLVISCKGSCAARPCHIAVRLPYPPASVRRFVACVI